MMKTIDKDSSSTPTGTRQRIARIALRLFRERGFAAVSIRDICQESSLAIGSFYYHFKSKDEIINTCHQQMDEIWEESLADFRPGRDFREDILFLFETAGRVMEELGWEMTAQSYAHHITSHGRYILQKDRPIYIHLRELFASNPGALPPETDPDALLGLLIRTGRGILFDWCLTEGSYDLCERIREDLSLLLKAFTRPLHPDPEGSKE